jgi:hypothetical protein
MTSIDEIEAAVRRGFFMAINQAIEIPKRMT